MGVVGNVINTLPSNTKLSIEFGGSDIYSGDKRKSGYNYWWRRRKI